MDGGREDTEIPVEEEDEEKGKGGDGGDLDYCPDLFAKRGELLISHGLFAGATCETRKGVLKGAG